MRGDDCRRHRIVLIEPANGDRFAGHKGQQVIEQAGGCVDVVPDHADGGRRQHPRQEDEVLESVLEADALQQDRDPQTERHGDDQRRDHPDHGVDRGLGEIDLAEQPLVVLQTDERVEPRELRQSVRLR